MKQILCLLSAVLVLASSQAFADFRNGLKLFQAGDYSAARNEFLALAELGDGASQYNLAAMSMQGQGSPKDLGTGVGWLRAAASNGYSGMPTEKLTALYSKLQEGERQAADAIVARYGHETLKETVLPQFIPITSCPDFTPAEILQMAPVDYPPFRNGQDGVVISAVTVGVDGLARDPQTLMAVPSDDFAAVVIAALLQSRFKPATYKGLPVEARLHLRSVFMMTGGGVLWNLQSLRNIRAAADAGDPGALYIIGFAATLDRSLNIPLEAANAMLLSAAQGGQSDALYWMAHRMVGQPGCTEAVKRLVWLRRSAIEGAASAQVDLARSLLAESASSAEISEARTLLEQAAASHNRYANKHAAALLATSTIADLRNPKAALQSAKNALKFPLDGDPQLAEAVAAAQAVNGDFKSALSEQKRAISSAHKLHWNTQYMDARLAEYGAGRAWTGDLFAVAPLMAALPPVKRPINVCISSPTTKCKERVPDQPKATTGSHISK